MSDCCSSACNSLTQKKRHLCPVNGKEYRQVKTQTILHHIKEPWSWEEKQQAYYYCDDPECDVVYFGQDDSLILKNTLRTTVGIKEKSDTGLLCYCFGVSFSDAMANPKIKQYVTDKTKHKLCACDVQNPSGKCCLKDFPK